jgi:hypothetical protein
LRRTFLLTSVSGLQVPLTVLTYCRTAAHQQVGIRGLLWPLWTHTGPFFTSPPLWVSINAFKVHSHCDMCWCFSLFYDQRIFHLVGVFFPSPLQL